MSSSVFLHIYTDELSMEDKSKISELMKFSSTGSTENSEQVARSINDNISEVSCGYFAYWNFRKGQDIDAEEVIEHFKTYALLASKFVGRSIVSADHHDTRWMYDESREYPMSDEHMQKRREDIRLMKLRKKVEEGKSAQEKLKNLEPKEEADSA